MTGHELLELAAKAAGYDVAWNPYGNCFRHRESLPGSVMHVMRSWNPLTDDGDRYRLARQLGINIDFGDSCAWKRLLSGRVIQEFWDRGCGDEAHAVVRVAAEIALMGKEPT